MNEPFFINVLENDTDLDGESLTITSAVLTGAVRNNSGTTTNIDLAALGTVTIENNQVKLDSNISSNLLQEGETVFINVEYTITDIHGATDTALLTLVITDKDDQAILQNDSTLTDQNTFITTNVFANDKDPDSILVLDNIEVLNVFNQNNESLRSQGNLSIQDNQIVLTNTQGDITKSFGLLQTSENGDVTFNPNDQWNSLAQGENGSIQLLYNIKGSSETALYTITIQGLNDAPEVNPNVSLDQVNIVANETPSIKIPDNAFVDQDIRDDLTITVANLPRGLIFNQQTNTIEGSPVGVSGDFLITIIATDPYGLSTSRTMILDIEPSSVEIIPEPTTSSEVAPKIETPIVEPVPEFEPTPQDETNIEVDAGTIYDDFTDGLQDNVASADQLGEIVSSIVRNNVTDQNATARASVVLLSQTLASNQPDEVIISVASNIIAATDGYADAKTAAIDAVAQQASDLNNNINPLTIDQMQSIVLNVYNPSESITTVNQDIALPERTASALLLANKFESQNRADTELVKQSMTDTKDSILANVNERELTIDQMKSIVQAIANDGLIEDAVDFATNFKNQPRVDSAFVQEAMDKLINDIEDKDIGKKDAAGAEKVTLGQLDETLSEQKSSLLENVRDKILGESEIVADSDQINDNANLKIKQEYSIKATKNKLFKDFS